MADQSLKQKIVKTVQSMGSIPFFPNEPAPQEAIMREISKFVDTPERLDWLLSAALTHMRKWEGLAELRGLYCTKFRPADGESVYCSIPGFSANDCEASYIEEEIQQYDRKMLAWREEQKLLGEASVEINMPKLKEIGAPSKSRTETDLRAMQRAKANEVSLAQTVGIAKEPEPIHVPGTRKRTPEENAAILRELEAQLAGGAK